jgi:hypothetical protein
MQLGEDAAEQDERVLCQWRRRRRGSKEGVMGCKYEGDTTRGQAGW